MDKNEENLTAYTITDMSIGFNLELILDTSSNMATLTEFDVHLIEQNTQLTKEIKVLEELIPETIMAVLPLFNVEEFGNHYTAMVNSFHWKIIEDRELNQKEPKPTKDAEPPKQPKPTTTSQQQHPPQPQPTTTS